jgi:hypothetical protein
LNNQNSIGSYQNLNNAQDGKATAVTHNQLGLRVPFGDITNSQDHNNFYYSHFGKLSTGKF